jgi:hypothetical protein
MKHLLSLTAALAIVTIATPALAQNRGTVIVGGSGNRAASAAQQPTGYLTTETASTLTDGLAYISAGGVTGAMLPGATVNYRRGMGRGGELAFGAALNIGLAPSGFLGGVGAGWKQNLVNTGNMGVAFNAGVALTGLGGPNALGLTAGLPLTFGGGLSVHPRLSLPTVTGGASATAGGTVGAGIGFQTPIAPMWQFLGEVSPAFGLDGSGFRLPLAVGTRFSPTATSHVDVSLGALNVTPAFAGNIGLVNVTGHIGF